METHDTVLQTTAIPRVCRSLSTYSQSACLHGSLLVYKRNGMLTSGIIFQAGHAPGQRDRLQGPQPTLGGSSELREASEQSHMSSVRWDGVSGSALPKDILIPPKEKQRSEAQRGSGPGPGLRTQTAAILQLQAPDEVLGNFKINASK